MSSTEGSNSAESEIVMTRPSTWLIPFCLSDKFKFAFRVAVSLTFAYLFPMAMGWSNPSTAATTVMLIASTGSRRESLAKGTLRVLGTLLGGFIGLVLVGMFAQDRMLYLLVVSLVVTVVFYIRSAYLNDPTLFMLTGVTTLMMYHGGDAQGAFLYGIERIYMTVFGVVVYTLIGIFLFPPRVEKNLHQMADALAAAQKALFDAICQPPESLSSETVSHMADKSQAAEFQTDKSRSTDTERIVSDAGSGSAPQTQTQTQAQPHISPEADKNASHTDLMALTQAMFAAQKAFDTRYQTLNADCSEISAYKTEWDGAQALFSQITDLLAMAARQHPRAGGHPEHYIRDFSARCEEITALFASLPEAWESKEVYPLVALEPIECDGDVLKQASHLYRGEAITLNYLLGQLQEKLCQLRTCISSIDSVTGGLGLDLPTPAATPDFRWWDAENAKTSIKVLLTYWLATAFWINFNPPGGYNVVIYSALLVSLLSYMPIHPVLLLILFTLGFAFSVPSYVFILPQLTIGSELAVFIFLYTFIGFYLLKGPVTIFFLLGMFTIGINNTMVYNFNITITIVTMFYLITFTVILSHYLPFTSRPEALMLIFRERFFRHCYRLFRLMQKPKLTIRDRILRRWHRVTMQATLGKMKVWSQKVPTKSFPDIDQQDMAAFIAACEVFQHHLLMLDRGKSKLSDNEIVLNAQKKHRDQILPAVAKSLMAAPEKRDPPPHESEDLRQDYHELEHRLDQYFEHIVLEKHSSKDIAGFYFFLNLKKNLFESLMLCKRAHDQVPWSALRMTRF